MFVPQLIGCQESRSSIFQGKRHLKQSYEEKWTFARTQKDGGLGTVCGEGVGELILQQLLNVSKTIFAIGTFRVHLMLPYLWNFPTMN